MSQAQLFVNVLIVDDDAETRDLLREQIFSSSDFRVLEAKDGATALQLLKQRQPDLIVLDLQLPGLSGRDMLIALKSQGYRGPLIVTAQNTGGDRSIIEAFRLGATDYITRPIRETEVMSAVERSLNEVRLRQQRDTLVTQVQSANQQLEARVRELETLYHMGQTVTSMRELDGLFERVLGGAISVSGADHAMLFLRDDKTGQLILKAGKNMRLSMLDRLGEAVNDQLAELVMTSQEPLVVAGDGLKRFSSAKDLYAVAYVPLTVQSAAIGALAVGNHQTNTAFNDGHGRLLKALADYAAIALVNARLFGMLEERAGMMEKAYTELRERDAQRGRQLQILITRLYQPLVEIQQQLIRLTKENKLPKNVYDDIVAQAQRAQHLAVMLSSLNNQKPES
jgi:two-component system NtrC family sensor kinase